MQDLYQNFSGDISKCGFYNWTVLLLVEVKLVTETEYHSSQNIFKGPDLQVSWATACSWLKKAAVESRS